MPFYETSGSGNSNIILIHGFGLNRKSWYDLVPMLPGDSVIHLVDLIGFGDSPAPENWPYTIDAQAEILFDFIVSRNISDVVLGGHSYGGGVALMLVQKMLQRGNSELIKNLILIAPAAFPQALPFFITLPRVPVLGRAVLAGVSADFQMRTTLRAIFRNKQAVTEERIRRYVANIKKRSHRNALVQTARNIFPGNMNRLVKEIGKIKHKTLLVYGENDPVISKENLERLSRELPRVITRKIENCGHIPHEEYPQITAGLISEFLQICNLR
ncbi:alpha/beta fold hydrolase [Thermodesulfobacteriota bacterium]